MCSDITVCVAVLRTRAGGTRDAAERRETAEADDAALGCDLAATDVLGDLALTDVTLPTDEDGFVGLTVGEAEGSPLGGVGSRSPALVSSVGIT